VFVQANSGIIYRTVNTLKPRAIPNKEKKFPRNGIEWRIFSDRRETLKYKGQIKI